MRKEWQQEGVYFEGEKNIYPYLKKCSLSLHLGRGESFGINILETMLAGVPTIVSNYTGAKQVVTKVNKKLVVPLSKEIVSKKVVDYFNLNSKKKRALSKKRRKIATKFNENEMLKSFKKQFSEFIIQI